MAALFGHAESRSAPEGAAGELRALVRCLAMLAAVLLAGSLGFTWLEEDWSYWRSLYFTLITITTVGYSDQGVSPQGRVLASLVLLSGIGTATYALNQLVHTAVAYQFSWKKNMQRRIDELADHVIVCGFGRIGKTICRRLAAAGVPVVVLDRNEREHERAREEGYLTLLGNATEDETLQRAGVERCRGVVCVVNSDAENVFIALSARHLNPKAYIACRADTEDAGEKIRRAGASLVVSPHYSAGVEIATAILSPHLANLLHQGRRQHGEFALVEVQVDDGAVLAGQSLAAYGRSEPGLAFVAMRRAGQGVVIRPPGDEVFRPGDIVIVAGRPDAVARMRAAATRRSGTAASGGRADKDPGVRPWASMDGIAPAMR